jgi:hypothetical protein
MPVDEAWDRLLAFASPPRQNTAASHDVLLGLGSKHFLLFFLLSEKLGRPARRAPLECRPMMIAIENVRWKDTEFARVLE